ncbi:hypothetical protein A5722_32360 [Mycobacterium vulneris]|nr:hypothetical protein A5722_32360 [Mycolicibacterium vulneris]OCB67820.1 hypothetical protein A5729_06750 [Mycolicibacterium vulneris]
MFQTSRQIQMTPNRHGSRNIPQVIDRTLGMKERALHSPPVHTSCLHRVRVEQFSRTLESGLVPALQVECIGDRFQQLGRKIGILLLQ